ncbi:hypothetical protein, partial [Agrobacterium tumefaciens]
ITDIEYYVAFSFYKLAIILQQLYYRWKKGETDDARFSVMNIPIANLFDLADLTRRKKIL